MKNIKWYDLDQYGYTVKDNRIIQPFSQQSVIYVYKFEESEETKLYIGSTIDINRRCKQHRYRTNIFMKTSEYNTIFYNYVALYGWKQFKLGILEYININSNNIKEELFKKEQYYLDLLQPKLNTNKTANTLINCKASRKKKIMELLKSKNTSQINLNENKSIKPFLSDETIIKLKLHNKDITVSVTDKYNNIIKQFARIRHAAEFAGLSPSSVSGYIKSGKLWKDTYYFKLKVNTNINKLNFPLNNKDNNEILKTSDSSFNNTLSSNSYKVEVFNGENKIYLFKSVRQASKFLNISKITITNYFMANKLWKNKYKFNIII